MPTPPPNSKPRLGSPPPLSALWGVGGTALLLLAGLAAGPAPHRSHHPRVPTHRRYNHVRYTAREGARLLVNAGPPPAPSRPVRPPKPRVPTAADLYVRSLEADTRYSYRGRQVTTYWKNGRVVAVMVAHRAPALLRIDYLAPDAERGRSLVRDETQEWQWYPQRKLLLTRPQHPDLETARDAEENYQRLRANYVLSVLPETRVLADRKVFVLTMTRKADRTPARKLWIDAATGLVLKRENYREDGKLLLTVAFSDISFRAPLPRGLFTLAPLGKRAGVRVLPESSDRETPVPLPEAQAQLAGRAVVPLQLGGYQLVSAALSPGKRPRLHLTYSDGLSLVSLFEQVRAQTRYPTRVAGAAHPFRMGGTVGHVLHPPSLTALVWDRGALNLVLMGEVSERTLTKLAAAVP